MDSPLAIGIDVGATKIASALVSKEGEVLAAHQLPTAPARGVKAVLDDIAQEIAELAHMAEELGLPAGGVGIGVPGQVNSEAGWVRDAVNLGWREVSLTREIQGRLKADLTVWIQKDANASALGEYYLGAARGCADFLYLGVGSGLGSGVMVSGRLVTGATWIAANVGHLSLDPEYGDLCACGLRGCAETVVSGPGLLAVTKKLGKAAGILTNLALDDKLTSADVVKAAEAGDPLAKAAVEKVGSWLGMVAASCISLLNPARIVIGGGLGLAIFADLKAAVQNEIGRRVPASQYLGLLIVPSEFVSSAVGPACLVWYGLATAQPSLTLERR